VTTFHTEAIGRLFVGGNKENTRKRTSSFVGLLIRILVTLGLSYKNRLLVSPNLEPKTHKI